MAVDCREALRNFDVALALVIFRQAAEVPISEVHGGMKLLARPPPTLPVSRLKAGRKRLQPRKSTRNASHLRDDLDS
jgi:hypothetical protein